jgi:hypothetical protein
MKRDARWRSFASPVVATSVVLVGVLIFGVVEWGISGSLPVWYGSLVAALGGGLIAVIVGRAASLSGPGTSEKEARARLRQAEHQLAQSLEQQLVEPKHDGQGVVEIPGEAERAAHATQDRLTLPALWEVTHSRLDLYHQIATGQARRSFLTAQVAIGAGFALLIAFAVLAAETQTTAGAITTAALGAVSAALAGYISRTFVRSQESAAAHLRAYFDQPLDFSKYLAAERLLASNADLDGDKRAAILTALVQAIVAPSPSANGTASKLRRRKAAQ